MYSEYILRDGGGWDGAGPGSVILCVCPEGGGGGVPS